MQPMAQTATDRRPPAPRPSNACVSSDLILDFVNTRARGDDYPELLGDSVGLAAWIAGSGSSGQGAVATDADAAVARELREAMVALLRAHSGCNDELADAEDYLARIAERYPLTPRLDAGGCTLVSQQSGIPGLLGSLFAAAADLASRGAWQRLRICKDPACRTGFFDKTRNSSGLYCSSACSSKMAMRAYRSRLKSA
jgi:predicted RNA-binding Zn ribbon-like protein